MLLSNQSSFGPPVGLEAILDGMERLYRDLKRKYSSGKYLKSLRADVKKWLKSCHNQNWFKKQLKWFKKEVANNFLFKVNPWFQ